MSHQQIGAHVRALNRVNDQSVSFEWEVVVLNAFSKFGSVRHEPDLGGRTRVDLLFRPATQESGGFAADVVTAYELGREERNPLRFFQDELIRRVRKAGLEPNRFGMRIEGALRGQRHRRVMDLKLPSKREANILFDQEFVSFLTGCAASPDRPHTFARRTLDVHLEITFDPHRPYFSTSHPAFDVAYSLTRNPIYNALERKAAQLRDANAPPPLGIILCSADVRLRPSRMRPSLETHDGPKIIKHFLKQNSSIGFVMAIESEDSEYRFGSRPQPGLSTWVYVRDSTKAAIDPATQNAIDRAHTVMPVPVNSGRNGLNHLRGRRPQEGRSFYGALTMTDNIVKLSSRGVLELLAGKISQEDFLARHSLSPGQPSVFEAMMRQGRTITEVEIERSSDKDDDWLVFRFGPADAAITKFRSRLQQE